MLDMSVKCEFSLFNIKLIFNSFYENKFTSQYMINTMEVKSDADIISSPILESQIQQKKSIVRCHGLEYKFFS